MLSRGLPVRHHIVVYTYVRLVDPLTSTRLQESLRLDEGEVGASTWLSRSMVDTIVRVTDASHSDSAADCQRSCDVEFPDTIE